MQGNLECRGNQQKLQENSPDFQGNPLECQRNLVKYQGNGTVILGISTGMTEKCTEMS